MGYERRLFAGEAAVDVRGDSARRAERRFGRGRAAVEK
jgi:hypothetical protein